MSASLGDLETASFSITVASLLRKRSHGKVHTGYSCFLLEGPHFYCVHRSLSKASQIVKRDGSGSKVYIIFFARNSTIGRAHHEEICNGGTTTFMTGYVL